MTDINLNNGECPVCGSDQLDGDSIDIVEHNECVQQCTCLECGSGWDDIYRLKAQIVRERKS